MNPRTRPPNRNGLARRSLRSHEQHGLSPAVSPSLTVREDSADIAGNHTNDQTEQPLLYTAEQAAGLLQVRPSWLRRKAAARAVPCRYLGKHLRFSRVDIEAIADASSKSPTPHRRYTGTS